MEYKYDIKETDQFDRGTYSEVAVELRAMNQSIGMIQGSNKSDIVISFLKDHCIKNDWVERNRKLAKLMTSGLLETSRTESLFESCRGNERFLRGFEDYIKGQID